MPKLTTLGLSVLLAAAIHVDWHLARPLHHRLSLGLTYHWVVTALVFAIVGWFIARRWPDARWRLGFTVLLGAIAIGQMIEPMSEVILYQHRLGYPDEPARWIAFAQAMAAAVPAYVAALWLCVRQPSVLHAS